MTTLRFIAWRFAQSVPLMFLSSIVVFVAVSLAGDPLDRYRQPGVPQSTIDAKAAELGLDQSLPARYWDWITGVLHGDFGMTSRGLSVSSELLDKSMVSLRLIALAMILSVVLAIAVGFFAAINRDRRIDRVLMTITVLLLTAPEFWVATILKQGTIATQDATGTSLLATVGDSSPGMQGAPFGERLMDQATHLVLPTIVLAAYPVWALYQRAAMVEVVDSDYIKLAQAKGLRRRRVMFLHGLRNALVPVVTVIALRLPWIISGLVVVESIFGWAWRRSDAGGCDRTSGHQHSACLHAHVGRDHHGPQPRR